LTIIRVRRGKGAAPGGVRVTGFVETEGKELMSFLHLGKDLVPVRPGEDFTGEDGWGGLAIGNSGDGAEQATHVLRAVRQGSGLARIWRFGAGGLRLSRGAPPAADLGSLLLVGRALARDRAGVYLRNFRRCGELRPPVADRGFIDAHVPGDGAVA
jgi:hypothetical protein